MTTKIVVLKKETYDILEQLKQRDESIDELIIRLAQKQTDLKPYMDLASEENMLRPKVGPKEEILEKTISVNK